MTGIGHNNALNILNDVAAGHNINALGHLTQGLAGQSCTVGHSDRLGATHCRKQFFLLSLLYWYKNRNH